MYKYYINFFNYLYNIYVLYDTPLETRTLAEGEMRELKDKVTMYLSNLCVW